LSIEFRNRGWPADHLGTDRLDDIAERRPEKTAVRATAENDTIHNEPFEVRPDMVVDAIMAADAMGRAWRKDHSPHKKWAESSPPPPDFSSNKHGKQQSRTQFVKSRGLFRF
jgi:hypothetical protein